MNKSPQLVTVPPTPPHPSPPSSGLPQPSFLPGQPPSLLFAIPQPPQMNPAAQPRQTYYTNGASLPPSHVYQAGSGSQMMITQQQLSFTGTPQGTAYLIAGQYRLPTYMGPPQPYSVPGFYQSPTPAEYGRYGPYYPVQLSQFTTSPISMIPSQQQQPPLQLSPHDTKRERKQITIKDPNRGNRDVTNEILSRGCHYLSDIAVPEANGENITAAATPALVRPDEGGNATFPHLLQTELSNVDPDLTEATSSDINPKESGPLLLPLTKNTTLKTVSIIEATTPVADMMDASQPPRTPTYTPQLAPEVPAYPAPFPDLVPVSEQIKTDVEVKEEEVETQLEEANCSLEISVTQASSTSVLAATQQGSFLNFTTSQVDDPLESPIAQPEELFLPNGHHLPALLESEAPFLGPSERDDSPIAEPDFGYPPVSEAAAKQTVSAAAIDEGGPTEAASQAKPAQPETQVVVTKLSFDDEVDASTIADERPCTREAASVALLEGCSSCPLLREDEKDTQPAQKVTPSPVETTFHAVSVPKKRRKLKDLNKKELVGDLLDAFKEVAAAPPEPDQTPPPAPEPATPPPAPEEGDLTWEDREEKLDAENIQPDTQKPDSTDNKYQKKDQWKPINPGQNKKYDREFLLGFQFIPASMNKPEGLPTIKDVIIDKTNKTPLRQLNPSRLIGMNCSSDFTPSFANMDGPRKGLSGKSRIGRSSKAGLPIETEKCVKNLSLNSNVKLHHASVPWKPNSSAAPSEELFKQVRSILNKLTPQKFHKLMKQVEELRIDTEEKLKGVINLTFEKAISEPDFSVAYANMCSCLTTLKVDTPEKPEVSFLKLLLNRCQKEFEKDKDDDETFEKKQKELEAASGEEEKQRLIEELEEAKVKARRRSLGNIRFIGELFKLKMLTELIMHDCILKLLKNHDEESLECLCRLLSTIGKDLDTKKAKPRMDQYFKQMEKIIKERKTSSRIRFMLQDVLDLRQGSWVPRRGHQGPKTIDQIHKEAAMEEQKEQIKVQQALISRKDSGSVSGGRVGAGGPGGRGSPHTPRHGAPSQNEGWSTVPISKTRAIDTSRLCNITKTPPLDANSQRLAPGSKGMWGSWGKGSSGFSSAKSTDSDSGSRPGSSTPNRFSALQQSLPSSGSSVDSDRRISQRNSLSCERSNHSERSERGSDRHRMQVTKRSFTRDKEGGQPGSEGVRRVADKTDDREQGSCKEKAARQESAAPTPTQQNLKKPLLTEEEMEKKATSIIEEYLHINDMKEAVQCVQELSSPELLFVFVRIGLDSTLERSSMAREHMGYLLQQLMKTGLLTAQQYYKGFQETLEVAEDMEIDIPHVFLYLAELITPMLHEGGIPMAELFMEISKPLIPLNKAGILLAHILTLLCKEMGHTKAGTMWREAGLRWTDFLPEDVDVNKFVTEKCVEFTLGDQSKSSRKEVNSAELTKHLDKLIQDKADNQRIFDWIEGHLAEHQTSSNMFIRTLMTCICQSAIICGNSYKLNEEVIKQRADVLQRYLKDEQKELQALYALQALMVQMQQPTKLLLMFFDVLYDEDVIKEEAFYKWESSKEPSEQEGKGVALMTVTEFFKFLHNSEEKCDNS